MKILQKLYSTPHLGSIIVIALSIRILFFVFGATAQPVHIALAIDLISFITVALSFLTFLEICSMQGKIQHERMFMLLVGFSGLFGFFSALILLNFESEQTMMQDGTIQNALPYLHKLCVVFLLQVLAYIPVFIRQVFLEDKFIEIKKQEQREKMHAFK